MKLNTKQLQRFINKIKIDPLEGCWLWQATINARGYGHICINYKQLKAHRVSYEHWKGEIPSNLQVDHLCKNTSCVNPLHLEIVTQKENMVRSTIWNKMRNKTHCPSGHQYKGENLKISKRGYRICKKCEKRDWKKYQMNHRIVN